MKKLIQMIMVMAAIAIAIPSFSQENKNADKMKAKIQKLNNQITEAAVKGDTEAGMAFYADDVVYMPNYGKIVRGKEALREREEEGKKAGVKVTAFTLTTEEVNKSGSLIYEIGTYSITLQVPQSPEPVDDYGKYVCIWEKTDAGMFIKVDIWNTDISPWNMKKEMKQEKDGGVEKSPTSSSKSQTESTITKSGKKPVDPNSEQNPDKK